MLVCFVSTVTVPIIQASVVGLIVYTNCLRGTQKLADRTTRRAKVVRFCVYILAFKKFTFLNFLFLSVVVFVILLF